MTKQEEQRVNELFQQLRSAVSEIKSAGIQMSIDATEKSKKQYAPFNLEIELNNRISSVLTESFDKFAKDSYNNPIYKYLAICVENRKSDIMNIYDELLKETLASDTFKTELKQQVAKKVAQSVVAQSQSVIDRSVQNLKQDETFKAKLTLAINTLIEEYSNKQ